MSTFPCGAQRERKLSMVELTTGHLRSLSQVINGIVVSADDPASSLHISSCTFENSSSAETVESRGLGGAVYATGSLRIENSTFSENHVSIDFDVDVDLYTPAPTAMSSGPKTQVLLKHLVIPTGVPCSMRERNDRRHVGCALVPNLLSCILGQ